MFSKLDFIYPNIYKINKRKEFAPILNVNTYLSKICNFAYDMTFAQSGYHRNHRSGGLICRNNAELFVNILQGKIAEFAVYKKLVNAGLMVCEPDLNLLGKGLWDSSDFCFKGQKISVKSAAHFSNLLLLEKNDWNLKGEYIPNIDSDNAIYDFFIFCRIKPDSKSLFTAINSLCDIDGNANREQLEKLINAHTWEVDIPGCMSHKNFVAVISNNYILPQGSLLNGKIKMDATNYYVQAGDLHAIEKLICILKNEL
jgi:hypothetical protein